MKILSIDFDTIMFPCIKLYNEYCNGSDNDTQIWNRLEFEKDISQYFKYDANVYRNIVHLIFNTVINGAKFIPIREHQMIVDYLKNYDLINEPLEITNIDYHHDIMYHKDSLIQIDFDNYSCADWAGYLLNKNNKNLLTWYRCPGSTFYDSQLCSFAEDRITVKTITDLLSIDPKYDLIFFCLSPQWVPYIYHHLYDLIVDLIQLNYPDKIELNLKPSTVNFPENKNPSEIFIPIEVLVCKNAETGEEIILDDNKESREE